MAGMNVPKFGVSFVCSMRECKSLSRRMSVVEYRPSRFWTVSDVILQTKRSPYVNMCLNGAYDSGGKRSNLVNVFVGDDNDVCIIPYEAKPGVAELIFG